MDEIEEWKTLAEFPGYEMSSLGRLKIKNGSISTRKPVAETGYLTTKITDKNNKSFCTSIHRLIAMAFIPNTDPTKILVNHKNGIRHDNRASNLEWVTSKENCNDKKFPHKVFMRKVNQYTPDGKFVKEWESMADVGRFLGITKNQAGTICKNNEEHSGFIWKAQTCKRDDNNDLPGEKWNSVVYEGTTIQVSNKGRVITSMKKKTFGSRQCKYLYLWINGRHRPIHQIVCAAFHGPCPDKDHVVNHIDNNGQNNSPENLEWVTISQNSKHGRQYSKSTANHKRVNQYSLNGELLGTYGSITLASRFAYVNRTDIGAVCKHTKKTAGGYVWKYTSEDNKIANVIITRKRK